ncbi:MAG: co-chaperone GroES [Bdellovibrionota bacterium]
MEKKKESQEYANWRKGKSIRKINPIGLRVVVSLIKDNDMTDGGLYLPEGSKERMQDSLLAEVIEVASAIDKDSDTTQNISGIPLNAIVLIPKGVGVKVPWDDNLRIIDTKDVLAIIDEIELV